MNYRTFNLILVTFNCLLVECDTHSPGPIAVLEPSITISYPYQNQNIDAQYVSVVNSVQNFILSTQTSGPNRLGEGHIQIYVDNIYNNHSFGLTGFVYFPNTGSHWVKVELVNIDSSSLAPPRTDSIAVNVIATGSRMVLTGVKGDTTLLTMDIRPFNFILNPSAMGGVNVAGEGHYRIVVEGAFRRYGATQIDTLGRISSSPKYILVELVNNDHSSLNPTVKDSLLIDLP